MQEENANVAIDRLDVRVKSIEGALDAVRQMSLEDAAAYYVNFRDVFDYLDLVRDKWATVKDQLSKVVLPEIFERSNVDQSITLKSGFRVTVSFKTLASMKDKVGGMEWLKNNGLADIIQPTVNASTLASVAKTMAEENRSLPSEYFNVTLQPNTSVTKAKK